eukprot:m.30729 g.30729  ORF g.30729 m.30729 type:complete len:155 (+) comp8233_c0_seq1:159-623(+)
MAKGPSERTRQSGAPRVIDEKTRQKRIQQMLLKLDADHHNDESFSKTQDQSLFDEDAEEKGSKSRKKKRKKLSATSQRFRRTLETLITDAGLREKKDEMNYCTAVAPPPLKPPRKTCAVCGYLAKYTCTLCGTKYCSLACLGHHKETRCLRYGT